MNSEQIQVEEVCKDFDQPEQAKGKLKVLDRVSFDIAPNEFTALVGSSGCGKSTLLRILAGLEKPTSGEIKHMPSEVAFVFQNFALFPWLSVYDNIAYGLKMMGLSRSQIKHRVNEEVVRIGLQGFEKAHPKELSGGMKQRVGIARALAMHPSILFLDEPFSALDEITAKKLRQDLLRVWRDTNITIVMVTHLVEEAVQLADKVIVMSPRPGRVAKIIPNHLKRPRDMRSKEFFELVDTIEALL